MLDDIVLKEKVMQFTELIKEEYTFEREMDLLDMIEELRDSIPEKKKTSFGIVSVIAAFCKCVFNELGDSHLKTCENIYRKSTDYRSVCIGLGLLSHYGIKDPESVLPILAEAADHPQWEVREFVQMFLRKITKNHKVVIQSYLMELAKSSNQNLRRFASESLRPVAENSWIQEEPEYSLKVLRILFLENEEFPRVSVGNNLSDLSRKNPELIYAVVEELKALNNDNSDFIAHRACRNLIIEDPMRVLNLLKIDVYKYKNRVYHRKDFTRRE